jgi:class 3 adenylate cyclase
MLSQMGQAQPTILFADLAGYTALSEAHGDRQAADVVAEFSAAVHRLLSSHAAREVKTIGDALRSTEATPPARSSSGSRLSTTSADSTDPRRCELA